MILNMYWPVVKMWKFVVVGLILNTISASHMVNATDEEISSEPSTVFKSTVSFDDIDLNCYESGDLTGAYCYHPTTIEFSSKTSTTPTGCDDTASGCDHNKTEVPQQSNKPTEGCPYLTNTMPTSTSEVVTSTTKETTPTTEIPITTESMTSTPELIKTITDDITSTEIPTTTTKVMSTTTTEMPTSTADVMTTTTTTKVPITTTKSTTTTDMTTTKKIETTTEALKCPLYATPLVQKAMFSLSIKLLYEITKGSSVASGVSFVYLLGLLKLRASPKSKLDKELSELFGTADNHVIKCGLVEINKEVGHLPADAMVQFVNYIISNDQQLFSNITKDDMKYVIGSDTKRANFTDVGEAFNLNFDDQVTASEIINEKVKNQTMDKITGVLGSPQLVNKMNQLTLVSGLYYLSPFLYKPKQVSGNFSVTPCQTESIQFYTCCGDFLYTKRFSFEMVEFPMSGKQSLILIKPQKKDGHMELLKNPSRLMAAKDSMKPRLINLSFPAINASVTNDLLEPTKEMNTLSSLYTATTSQYKELFVKEQPANVTLAVQKINFISEAIGEQEPPKICEQSLQKIITIDFNSPFPWILFIGNTPSFMGVYANTDFAQF